MTTHTTTSLPRRWPLYFFPIWAGDALSIVATMLVQFALVWWFAKTTGSATTLAFGGVVGLLPQVLLGPFAGVLIDRWSRRVVMIVANACIALSTAFLMFLFATNSVQVWHVYVVLFVRALSSTFITTSLQATTAVMVPKAQLTRIAGLNQTMSAAANIGAPPLGAILVNALPMPDVLLFDVVAVLLAIVPLCFIAIPQPRDQADLEAPNSFSVIWKDLKEGFFYVVRWRAMRLFVLLAASINFLSAPLSILLPLLVTRYLGSETIELATMSSVYGVGALLGALTLSIWGGFKRRIVTTLASITASGIAVLLLGLAPTYGFPMALAAMGVLGFLMPFTNGPVEAVLQSTVAPEKQGRVFNLLSSLAGAAMPLGLVIAGPLADVFSLQAIFFTIAGLYFLVGAIAFSSPILLNIEAGRQSEVKTGVTAESV